MHLTINLANVKPAVDYVYSMGKELSRQETAMLALQAMNFKPHGVVVQGNTLIVYCDHPGDAGACAVWLADKLGTKAILTK